MMRAFTIFFVGIFLFLNNLHPAEYPAQDFGNKTHNLSILQEQFKGEIKVGEKVFKVRVPAFVGISDKQVRDFLNTKFVDGFSGRWQKLVGEYARDKAEILRTKKLPKDFLDAADSIAKNIRETFTKNTFPFDKAPKSFLDKSKNSFLMVRSTGKEDSEEMANAGGNESIANVSPDEKAVSQAMGEVVASYISEKSFAQRLALATTEQHVEEILITPFMPILLQIMIGEKSIALKNIDDELSADPRDDPTKTLRAGVMFTTEAEGNTPGVTQIQATFGHNEGVVNSLVPVDTFYVTNEVVHPVLRRKMQRIVPVHTAAEMRDLRPKPNGKKLHEAVSLGNETVQTLKNLANKIENSYGKAMDVEFVVDPTNDTIYLVQARPIIQNQLNPSYLKIDKGELKEDQKQKGVRIGVGDGRAKEIKKINEILIEDHLGAALTRYLDMSVDEREKIKCVITREMAASTSHEATTFRAEQMPILQLDEIEKLRTWFSGDGASIWIDIQRGLVIRGLQSPVVVDEWYVHPIPQELSLRKFTEQPAIKMSLKERLFPLRDEFHGEKLRDLVERLKEITKTTSNEAEKILRTILYRVFGMVQRGVQEIVALRDQGQRIIQALYASVFEILLALDTVAQPRDLRVLYAINFLEATLFQQVSHVIKGDSYALFLKALREERKARVQAILKTFDPQTAQYHVNLLRLGDGVAFTKAATQEWVDFVNGLVLQANNKKEVLAGFATFIGQMNKLDMLPVWFNVCFATVWEKNNKDCIKTLHELEREGSQSFAFLKNLQKQKELLDAFDLKLWENPANFEKRWKYFQEKMLKYSLSNNFLQVFKVKEKNKLSQLAALNVMNKLIEIFDLSIKAVKASVQYEMKEKVERFKQMIEKYFELFKVWVALVPKGVLQYHENWPLKSYLERIENIIKKLGFAEEQLSPSRNFSVASAIIGRVTEVERCLPFSLEDVFTLVHQNLLIVTSVFTSTLIDVDALETTKIFNDFKQELLEIERIDKTLKVSLTGIDIEKNRIVFRYNLPLRNHSIAFDLIQNKNEQVFVTYKFLGDQVTHWRRWDKIDIWAQVACDFSKMVQKSKKLTDNEFIVTYALGENSFLENISSDIRMFVDMSLNERITLSDEEIIKWFGKSKKDLYPSMMRVIRLKGNEIPSIVLLIVLLEWDEIDDMDNLIKLAKERAKLVVDSDTFFGVGSVLYRVLFSKGIGFKEAIDAVEKLVESEDSDLVIRGSVLLLALLEKDQAIEKAIKVAEKLVKSENSNLVVWGGMLFEKLVQKDRVIEEATKVAEKLVKSEDSSLIFWGEELKELLEQKRSKK